MSQKNRMGLLGKIQRKFERGPKNSITDVDGVAAGHLTFDGDPSSYSGKSDSTRTGLTAILPCSMKEEVRLYAGCISLRNGINDITGYQVTDDFCYLNSPLVLSNTHNVGRVYNAILSFGFSLGRSEVWPPLVLGIDDSTINGAVSFSIDETQIVRLLNECSNGPVKEGSVGIGRGLRAFGWKGGIGSSSRQFGVNGKQFLIASLVASNHSNTSGNNNTNRETSLKINTGEGGSLIVITATDAPLLPFQIKQILTNMSLSLPRINSTANYLDSITYFLFSTANTMSLVNDGPHVFDHTALNNNFLPTLSKAADETVSESILRSLLLSQASRGSQGQMVETIPESEFKHIMSFFEMDF